MVEDIRKHKIILASASPRRAELLSQAGFSYEVIPSQVEEIITKTIPHEIVMELAQQKANEVFKRYRRMGKEEYPDHDDRGRNRNVSETVILGADTIVTYGDRILGKPKSRQDAYDILHELQGKIHQVYTGVCLIGTDSEVHTSFVEKTDVEFYPMTDEEIQTYVISGDGMDKAGAYGIQTMFGIYVRKIHGDYNNVVGLPIARLYQEMKGLLVTRCTFE